MELRVQQLTALGLLIALHAGVMAKASGPNEVDGARLALARSSARAATQKLLSAFADDARLKAVMETEPVAWVEQGRLFLSWPSGTYTFRADGTRLLSASFPKAGNGAVGDVGVAAARASAVDCYARLTGRKDVAVYRGPDRDLEHVPGFYQFELAPVIGGVRCSGDAAGFVMVEGCSGRPVSVALGSDPIVGSQRTAEVGPAAAARTAWLDLCGFTDAPRLWITHAELIWEVPAFQKTRNRMEPEHVAAAQEGRSMLFHRLAFHARRTAEGAGGEADWLFSVDVDAVSGRTIAISSVDLNLIPMYGKGKQERKPLGQWPSPQAALEVLGAGPAGSRAAIAPCEPAEAPADGVRVALLSGKDAWNVRFDRKSGLVWMEAGGKRVYGRPNEPLRKALEKVKPTKPTPFVKRKPTMVGPLRSDHGETVAPKAYTGWFFGEYEMAQ